MTLDAGGETRYNAALGSVTKGHDGLVRLEFADGTVVHAHKVILAMPKRALRLLDPVGPLFDVGNAAVSGLIESVSSIPLFKIFVTYPYPGGRPSGRRRAACSPTCPSGSATTGPSRAARRG